MTCRHHDTGRIQSLISYLNKTLKHTVKLQHVEDTAQGPFVELKKEDGTSLGKLDDVQHNKNYANIPKLLKDLADKAIAAGL